MKIMKKSFFRFFDKVILLLLGGSGMFSACMTDYGMPYAEYEVKGTVTNSVTSQPIQNVRIVGPHFSSVESGYVRGDTVYTDENGKYAFALGGSSTYQLKFEDIDGEENGGLFQTKKIEGTFTQADQVEKGKGWYKGRFVKTEDVALEREPQAAPMYGPPTTSFQP